MHWVPVYPGLCRHICGTWQVVRAGRVQKQDVKEAGSTAPEAGADKDGACFVGEGWSEAGCDDQASFNYDVNKAVGAVTKASADDEGWSEAGRDNHTSSN